MATSSLSTSSNLLQTRKAATPSQLALAWLLKQGDDIIPIPGTKRIKYLEENWDSQNIQLSDEDEADIRNFVEGVELLGTTTVTHRKAFEYVDTKEES